MSKVDNIIRAWKDEDYRLGLSEDEYSQIPQNPAGLVELLESDLTGVSVGPLSAQRSVTAWPACPSGSVCPPTW
jgi:mersacidin/lichenicidin family type 2 lantibiotic